MRRTILEIGILTALALCPVAADAAFITGSFDGRARTLSRIPQIGGPSLEIISYAPVTGLFGFETDPSTIPQPPVRESEVGTSGAIYYGLSTFMEFTIDGSTSRFDNSIDAFGGPQLVMRTTGDEQSLALDVSGPYWYSHIDFVAPAGGLFSAPTPLALDPTAVSAAASSAMFSGDIRSGGSDVTFSRITFDGYPSQPVPTPATFPLFLFGAACTLFLRRARA